MVRRYGTQGVLITKKEQNFFADYNSLIFDVDYKEHKIIFFRDWDYSTTTKKHLYSALRDIGISGLASDSSIRKAIKEGTFKNGAGIVFIVEYCEDEV